MYRHRFKIAESSSLPCWEECEGLLKINEMYNTTVGSGGKQPHKPLDLAFRRKVINYACQKVNS